MFVSVYVDDLLLLPSDEAILLDFITHLQKHVHDPSDVKHSSLCTEILGVKIDQQRTDKHRSIHLSQGQMVKELLQKFDAQNSTPKDSPAGKPLYSLEPNENPDPATHNRYRALVGSLLYLSGSTRPDITFPTNQLCRFMHAPSADAMKCALRILRYLKSDVGAGIHFAATGPPITPTHSPQSSPPLYHPVPFSTDPPTPPTRVQPDECTYQVTGASSRPPVKGAADSNWSSPRSCTGYIFTLCGGPLMWYSGMQRTAALSTSEAEWLALSAAVRSACYIIDATDFAGMRQKSIPIAQDNAGCITWASTSTGHSKRRHIDLASWNVTDAVTAGSVRLTQVPSREQPADFLTKVLPSPLEYKRAHQRFVTYKMPRHAHPPR